MPVKVQVKGKSELLPVACAVALVVICVLWGAWLERNGTHLHLSGAYPLTGNWQVRLSTSVFAPILLAVLVVWNAPALTERLPWRWLVSGAVVLAAGWATLLAATDGWAALGEPLATRWEYLHDVPRVADIGVTLDTFTSYVVGDSSHAPWTTHVGGHPPGALLVFVLMSRIGLGGSGWAAALCIGAGASAVAAVLLTMRSFSDEATARAAAPFLVLSPAALWIATSADALFLGVSAWGICALALGGARSDRLGAVLACIGGVLLGGSLFLSYGLAVLVVLAIVVSLAHKRIRTLVWGAIGVLAVILGFAALGFWWFEGLGLAADRVRQGAAWIDRPTEYFLLANIAALCVAVGPATIGALAHLRRRRVVLLPAGAAAAVLIGCASNLSKGEVERIYLPFELWLISMTAFLPARHRRAWLAAQAIVAIGLQITLRSKW